MDAETGSGRRWVWAVLGAAVVLGVLATLFRTPLDVQTIAGPPAALAPAPVSLVNLKKNDAALTDPTPLFLPTEWNAGQDALQADARNEPGISFAPYPEKLKFAKTELALDFPFDVTVPARAVDALSDGKPGQIFLGLRQTADELTQLPVRKAFVQIASARDGTLILAQPLTDAEPPAGAGWQPMEFVVAVDAMGLVGPPVLIESSRVAAVDGYFQNYLVKTLHAGERLTPGFYRICVGP